MALGEYGKATALVGRPRRPRTLEQACNHLHMADLLGRQPVTMGSSLGGLGAQRGVCRVKLAPRLVV